MADHTEAVVQLMGITGEDYPVAFALLEVRREHPGGAAAVDIK